MVCNIIPPKLLIESSIVFPYYNDTFTKRVWNISLFFMLINKTVWLNSVGGLS